MILWSVTVSLAGSANKNHSFTVPGSVLSEIRKAIDEGKPFTVEDEKTLLIVKSSKIDTLLAVKIPDTSEQRPPASLALVEE